MYFMEIIIKSTKGHGQISSNDTFFDDIWFSLFKKEEEENTQEEDYYRPVKTSHKRFCLYMLENR